MYGGYQKPPHCGGFWYTMSHENIKHYISSSGHRDSCRCRLAAYF